MRFTLHTMFYDKSRLRRGFSFLGGITDKIAIKRFPQEVHSSIKTPFSRCYYDNVFLSTAGGCTHIEHTVELSTRQPCMDGRYETYGAKMGVPTSTLSTLRAGGPARFCVSIRDTQTLIQLISDLKQDGIPWIVVGGGSNILFTDVGFDGCVIKMEISGTEVVLETESELHVRVGAGVVWDAFVKDMCERGLWGVENLSGIPGTVGATPVQNVGAYGVEIQEVLESVACLDTETGETTTFTNTECEFAYRDSFFKHASQGRYAITHVVFVLSKIAQPKIAYKDLTEYFLEKKPTLLEIREAVIAIRSHKFPDLAQVGTAGSFFKNPILSQEGYDALIQKYADIPSYPTVDGKKKIPLGWILDKALHLKGYRKGNVGLFENQSLILVAYSGATAQNIDTFAKEIAEKVFLETGIRIEREVICL